MDNETASAIVRKRGMCGFIIDNSNPGRICLREPHHSEAHEVEGVEYGPRQVFDTDNGWHVPR